ncbi:transposase [Enterococcus faecium]|uniref:transposase n=1 Tax=Enterococcus faecium TaxID=1352 RepID=UPI003F7AF49F
MNESRTDKVNENGYYERQAYDTCRHAKELKVPEHDAIFQPTVFWFINETKSSYGFMLEMYAPGVSTRKVIKIVEELWVLLILLFLAV